MWRHDNSRHNGSDLADIPGFRGCTAAQLAQIDRMSDRSAVLAGRALVRGGQPGREFYMVLDGVAAVARHGEVVEVLDRGDFFGTLNAIEGGVRTATVTAVSTLQVLIIGPQQFAALMADIAGFREVVLRTMSRALRAADELMHQLHVSDDERELAELVPLPAH
jgi:CRP-like cAMP-binding protein